MGTARGVHSRAMRVLLQRVSRASVRVRDDDGGTRTTGEVGRGVVLLVGFTASDTMDHVQWMVDKVAGLRIFEDPEGKLNLSLSEVAGGVLVVSQFTLYADASRGRRPSFVDAARPEQAIPLYEAFLAAFRDHGLLAGSGEFGAQMEVELVNDGPVTIWLER